VKQGGFSRTVEDIPAEAVRSHLERVLASPPFKSSKRSHRFLSYVVEAILNGHGDSLKERTLATEVFDRPVSWDAGDDTIVRSGAREVRKRLAQYYSSAAGMRETIRIELLPGSYAPVFLHVQSVASSPVPLGPPTSHGINPKRSHRAWLLGIAAVALIAVISILLSGTFAGATSFDEFWAPVWRSPYPVLVAIAHPLVYHPSSRATRLNDQRLGPTSVPIQRPLHLLPKELDGSDIVPVFDQYVGYGDAVAATSISDLLGKHSRDVRLRSADNVEFADFRDGPTVLIGAFTNRWTIELTQKFRLHFGYDAQGAPAVLDSADPSRLWSIPSKEDNGIASEDYFLVCRLANSPSGKLMVVAGGLTQFGTEAAGRFLIDSGRLDDALRRMGRNWQSRNVQVLFHAKVVGNSPSASELIAWHVW
jgi:hypothetical protein